MVDDVPSSIVLHKESSRSTVGKRQGRTQCQGNDLAETRVSHSRIEARRQALHLHAAPVSVPIDHEHGKGYGNRCGEVTCYLAFSLKKMLLANVH